ncbi:hypothetical protein OOK29_23940 [Streptomyces phaeochromogenes]|nr:hypothetical protein [Streptomyces phaeochromogenes]MCX5601203.1 hypothetical protein [Streptomyces phaeochromogenes]
MEDRPAAKQLDQDLLGPQWKHFTQYRELRPRGRPLPALTGRTR